MLWGCLSVSIGLVHFSTHSPVDEDPAKCVYRALICLSEAVDLTIKRGAHMHGSWGTYEGIDGSSHPITRQPLPHTSPSTTRWTRDPPFVAIKFVVCGERGAIFHTQQYCRLMIDHQDNSLIMTNNGRLVRKQLGHCRNLFFLMMPKYWTISTSC